MAHKTRIRNKTKAPTIKPLSWARVFRSIFISLVGVIWGVTFALIVLTIVVTVARESMQGHRDFVVYWATGQQLVHHANPYDSAALLQIERAAGLPGFLDVMYMRNLPFSLPLVYPLGLLSLRTASYCWSAILLGCLIASVYLLWVMHGRVHRARQWLGYSFAPACICIITGQTTLFALLGLVLFLCWHRSRPFSAGIALWLCMLKPHLFLPFGIVLLVWIVVSKNYRIAFGLISGLVLSTAFTHLIDPFAWGQYRQMARLSGLQTDFIPCISVVLRNWIAKDLLWLQYIPVLCACVWAVCYFWPRRTTWDWVRHNGSLLMLVSLLCAPYSWIYDASVILPTLLYAVFGIRARLALSIFTLMSACVGIALFANPLQMTVFYDWMVLSTPAWMMWYLITWSFTNSGTP